MSKTIQLITVVLLCTLVLSCNKYLGDPTNSTYDLDAQKFIDNAGITDLKQKSVLNTFIKQLKDSALWTKFVAIYPMIGGTASTNKFNLKNPEDTDSAYRLTFYGNPVFAATGVLFPTLADYADTHLADNALGGYTNASIGYYSRTQNTVSGYDIGCTDGARPFNELSIYCKEGDDTEWFGFNMDTLPANTTGLFMLSSSPTNVTRYRNGVIVKSKGSPPNNSYTNLTILIGKSRVTMHPGMKECALASIGNGLTDVEAAKFYNVVQNFETALGR